MYSTPLYPADTVRQQRQGGSAAGARRAAPTAGPHPRVGDAAATLRRRRVLAAARGRPRPRTPWVFRDPLAGLLIGRWSRAGSSFARGGTAPERPVLGETLPRRVAVGVCWQARPLARLLAPPPPGASPHCRRPPPGPSVDGVVVHRYNCTRRPRHAPFWTRPPPPATVRSVQYSGGRAGRGAPWRPPFGARLRRQAPSVGATAAAAAATRCRRCRRRRRRPPRRAPRGVTSPGRQPPRRGGRSAPAPRVRVCSSSRRGLPDPQVAPRTASGRLPSPPALHRRRTRVRGALGLGRGVPLQPPPPRVDRFWGGGRWGGRGGAAPAAAAASLRRGGTRRRGARAAAVPVRVRRLGSAQWV